MNVYEQLSVKAFPSQIQSLSQNIYRVENIGSLTALFALVLFACSNLGEYMLVLCFHISAVHPLFIYARIDHTESAWCRILGSTPYFPLCNAQRICWVAFVGTSVKETDVDTVQHVQRCGRLEESMHLYSEVPPNPWAHSADKDFQFLGQHQSLLP